MNQRFVLLDRDGTLIEERHYLSLVEEIAYTSRAMNGLALMQDSGASLLVVTNQSGVARGFISPEQLDAIHRQIRLDCREHGVTIDGFYVCTHLPEENCRCRKPETGLVMQAAVEHGFSPSDAVMIGDKPCDILLGKNIGATTVLVRTGYGSEYPEHAVRPDIVADDLWDAAQLLKRRWSQKLPAWEAPMSLRMEFGFELLA